MQIPKPFAKHSIMRVFLLSMAGVAALFSLMALGIWMSTTDVLMRERQLINELLPELDLAHQLTATTAGLQSQGFLLRSSQTKTELDDHQNKLELTIAEIQKTLNTAIAGKPDLIADLNDSMDGISDITVGLFDVGSQQIDVRLQIGDEVKAILDVLTELEKDVQRQVFSLTGKLLSISNSIKLSEAEQLKDCSANEIFYNRISEYDAISLAIQDYLLLGRDIVSLNAILEKVPLLADKRLVIAALKKNDLLIRALISRSNYISNADRTDTLLAHLSRLSTRLGAKQNLFVLQNVLLTQEQDQAARYELLQERTVLILERAGKFRNDTRSMVSKLAKESLYVLSRDRNVPLIISAIALFLLGSVSYWLFYRKTVLPLMVITKQLDDVGSDRFPKVLPDYSFKEMSALSSAMMQLDEAQKNMQKQDQQLQGVNRELQRANEDLSQFAHIASHDLQEPLRKLQQFSELLVEDYGSVLDKEGRYHIAAIRNSAQRMSILIKETLAYSRAGSSNQKLISVDLSQLLPQLLDEMELAVQEADGEFIIGDMPSVLANELGMAQLFRNLMVNALKYCRQDVPARVCISVDQTDDTVHGFVRIFIEDNGIGISADHLQRIFNPFERLKANNATGTGLGLAICKKVCDSHGWNLDVSSELDVGTRFVVSIPKSSVQ